MKKHRPKTRMTSRDASVGDVYETRWGNRWRVTGKTPKGRLLVERAGNRWDKPLQWTEPMLARLKKVRGEEAKAVAAAVTPEMENLRFPSGASLLDRLRGLPQRDPARKYYVYVIEQIRHGKREFYVGQTGKTPAQRFKEHKRGHLAYSRGAVALRKDLFAKVNPLYSRKDAERMEKVIARTLRKRGLSVKGGH